LKKSEEETEGDQAEDPNKSEAVNEQGEEKPQEEASEDIDMEDKKEADDQEAGDENKVNIKFFISRLWTTAINKKCIQIIAILGMIFDIIKIIS